MRNSVEQWEGAGFERLLLSGAEQCAGLGWRCCSPEVSQAAEQWLRCAPRGPAPVQPEGRGSFSIGFGELWIRPYKAFLVDLLQKGLF